MTKKLKATVTFTLIYKPDPVNYFPHDSSKLPTVEEMAKIDLDDLRNDCSWLMHDPETEVTSDVIVVEE